MRLVAHHNAHLRAPQFARPVVARREEQLRDLLRGVLRRRVERHGGDRATVLVGVGEDARGLARWCRASVQEAYETSQDTLQQQQFPNLHESYHVHGFGTSFAPYIFVASNNPRNSIRSVQQCSVHL